ncbi:helix-turn-helix domain-containing protein [Microbacterium sp.]|uniref:helix-turn-helix domain-containing protein n=1 Tax=Microbacterium sp. TaxID=51671 RepID=UPI003C73386A
MESQFWADLQHDLQDPEFAREYAAESVRIATIDSLINDLDALRGSEGVSKAALARAIGTDPSVVRRLFSASAVNPTVGTIAEVAAALGMKLVLEPMTEAEKLHITVPMRASAAA